MLLPDVPSIFGRRRRILFMAVGAQGFQFTRAAPDPSIRRIARGLRRRHYFARLAESHLTARSERASTAVLIKVGTLDDPVYSKRSQLVLDFRDAEVSSSAFDVPHIRNFLAQRFG